MQPVKLYIADDHNIIITGILSMLEGVENVEVLETANSGDELIQKLEGAEQQPDVVLMDIKMPNKNGIDATRELTEKHPDLKIMALTMYDDEEYVTTMLKAGAKGYVLKNTGKEELLKAIDKVAAGETYFSNEATAAVMSRYMNAGGEGNFPNPNLGGGGKSEVGNTNVTLTRREKEILKLIASEMTNQEIADKLFISPRTVHSHRRNLMQKVGVKNTAGLVRYAIQESLI